MAIKRILAADDLASRRCDIGGVLSMQDLNNISVVMPELNGLGAQRTPMDAAAPSSKIAMLA